MKMLLMCMLLVGSAVFANDAAEVEAVRQMIMDAYINGCQKGNTDAMRKGFHESFTMLVKRDNGEVTKVTRDQWIERIEEGKKKNPDQPVPEMKATFPVIQVEGNAAIVRVEVWRDGSYAFTDFMSLYKFEDGWKLVAKIFQGHR